MGLDCLIRWYDGKEFTHNLPKEIAEKFEEIVGLDIIGFDITKYNDNYFISFRGKAYAITIKKLTNISLYSDLESEELKSLYMKLDKFIETRSDYYEFEQIQKAYDKTWCLNEWIESFIDEYIPSPNEIIGLGKLFKICYENKLQLYASY
jgi:hypothetical protein